MTVFVASLIGQECGTQKALGMRLCEEGKMGDLENSAENRSVTGGRTAAVKVTLHLCG